MCPNSAQVMIIDDDESIRMAVTEVLSNDGFDVVGYSSAEEALDVLSRGARGRLPSIILLDINMPTMDGWEFLEFKTSNPRLAQIPVIVSSAEAELRSSPSKSFCHALRKPFDMDGLTELLRSILAQSALTGDQRLTAVKPGIRPTRW